MSDALEPTLVTCSIIRWRGYRSSTFVAVGDDDGRTVAESASFRWRREEPPPDSPDVRQAYEALVGVLLDAGWKAVDDTEAGAAWFERRFGRVEQRPTAASPPVAPAPAPPPEPAPRPAVAPATPARLRHVPVPVAPAPPRPPAAARGRSRPATAAGAVVLVAAGVAVGFALRSPTHAATATTVTLVRTRTAAPAARRAAGGQSRARRALPQVVLDVTDLGTPSWLEIRHGSATGATAYSGILPAGGHVTVRGPQLWARFAAAGNLSISVNGRRLPLSGTVDRVFGGARRASRSTASRE